MIVSPGSRILSSSSIIDSVASPEGTMTHTARGVASLEASSASVKAPSEPSVMISRVFSAVRL